MEINLIDNKKIMKNRYIRLNKITICYYMIQWILKINFPIYIFYKSDDHIFTFDKLMLITIIIQIIAFIKGISKWISFKYYIKDESIYLLTGLINKKQYMLKSECVQNVKMNSRLLLRLLNSKQLDIELYGNKEFKKIIKFIAISDKELNRIYSLLMKDKADNGLQKNSSDIRAVWKISIKKMLFAALTSSFWITVPMSIYLFLDDFVDLLDLNSITRLYDWFIDSVVKIRIWNILLMVFCLGIISVLFYLIKYWGFTIIKDDCNLKISYGIVDKKELVLSCNNIISMGLYTPIIRNLLGVTSIFIEGENNSSENISLTIFPIINYKEAKEIIQDWLNFNFSNRKEIRFPYISLILIVIRNLFSLIIIYLLNMKFNYLDTTYILLLLAGLLFFISFYQYKNTKFSYAENILIFEKCFISKTDIYLPIEQIHCVEVVQNNIQKKLKVSSLRIFYLANNCEKVFKIKNIRCYDSQIILNYILKRGD
ncbi:MAG: PH domain-containing protein [Clostridiales bacterium]|nr:PH domain-containing protein [Clostridiales bacterium]